VSRRPSEPNAPLAAALRAWVADPQALEAARLSVGYQGAAYLYTGAVDGQPVKLVLKRAADGWLTGWFHRRMLVREARAYRQLNEVDGVPHSPGLLDGEWLLLEFVDGAPLKAARGELREPEAFYARLLQVLHDVHAAGVAHGDLKRKQNVLVTADERPVVIDFGTAVLRDGGVLDRAMFRLVRRFDYNAWVKLKYRNELNAMTPLDASWYRPTLVETIFRQLRRFWRTVTFRQARRRRRGARLRAAEREEGERTD